MSFERLALALRLSVEMPPHDRRHQILPLATELALLLPRGKDGGRALMFAANAKKSRIALDVQREKQPSAFTVSGTVRIKEIKEPLWVALPFVNDVGHLDLSEARVIRWDADGTSSLVETAVVAAEANAMVFEATRPGKYGAIAPPHDPWIRATLDVVARLRPWLEMPGVLAAERETFGRKLVDRICTLILCAPDFRALDVDAMARLGLPALPGLPGLPGSGDWPGGGGVGSVCDFCLGSIFEKIPGGGGRWGIPPIVIPPVRCGEWKSFGPAGDPSFAGIGRVTKIAPHPTTSDIFYVSAAGGGIWQTRNRGVSYAPLMSQEPTLTMGAVAVAPSSPQVVYAASGEDGGGFDPAWPGAGIYRSVDAGRTWMLTGPLNSRRFSALRIHPTNPDIVFVAGNAGLHRTDDGGANWRLLSVGQVSDFVLAHDNPQRIYAAFAYTGIFQSATGGIASGLTPAFTQLGGGLPTTSIGWIKLAIGRGGANGSNFLIAKMGIDGERIFTTTDGGATWTEIAPNIAEVPAVDGSYDDWCSVIAVDPTDEDIMYAGGALKLARTTTGGATAADWNDISAGVHADQQDLVFDPNDADTLLLANDGGVYVSTDQGTTWEFRSRTLQITQFYGIDVSAQDPAVVAGGAQDNGVYYRTRTSTWHHQLWGDGTVARVDPNDSQIVYFSSQNPINTNAAGVTTSNVRKSTDGLQTHAATGTNGLSGGSPFIAVLALDQSSRANPVATRIVFLTGQNWLFRSTDGAQNWARVNDAAGNAFTTNGEPSALVFAPGSATTAYLGTTSGAVYRTTTGGAGAGDWQRIDAAPNGAAALFPNVPVTAIAVHPLNAQHVWIAFGGNGVDATFRPNIVLNPLGISHVFRTEDGGMTWVDASGRFDTLSLPDVPTGGLALDSSRLDVAFVGTDVGVFRSADRGTTWTTFQEALPRAPVTALAFHPTARRLYAATMGRGVWIRDI